MDLLELIYKKQENGLHHSTSLYYHESHDKVTLYYYVSNIESSQTVRTEILSDDRVGIYVKPNDASGPQTLVGTVTLPHRIITNINASVYRFTIYRNKMFSIEYDKIVKEPYLCFNLSRSCLIC